MENILTKIKESAEYVCENSKHVQINYPRLDELISNLDTKDLVFWLNSNPFNILDMDYKAIINFLLIYHTIGDYCFWGEPKWTISTPDTELDGSYAMIYLILKRLKENKSFDMSYEEFKIFLKANVEVPLIEDRYQNLVVMNDFLKHSKKDFYTLVKDLNEDKLLLEFILKNFPYFKDESIYQGKRVYFYKRAQLLTSDILHTRELLEKVNVNYHNLVGCADYKIPQVLRCLNILEFSPELAQLVDDKIELPKNCEMEIEIRANTLKVIDYISDKLDKKEAPMDINDYIWLLGQDKTKITKPYHRTITNHY